VDRWLLALGIVMAVAFLVIVAAVGWSAARAPAARPYHPGCTVEDCGRR
jgi:hypothetical protein